TGAGCDGGTSPPSNNGVSRGDGPRQASTAGAVGASNSTRQVAAAARPSAPRSVKASCALPLGANAKSQTPSPSRCALEREHTARSSSSSYGSEVAPGTRQRKRRPSQPHQVACTDEDSAPGSLDALIAQRAATACAGAVCAAWYASSTSSTGPSRTLRPCSI